MKRNHQPLGCTYNTIFKQKVIHFQKRNQKIPNSILGHINLGFKLAFCKMSTENLHRFSKTRDSLQTKQRNLFIFATFSSSDWPLIYLFLSLIAYNFLHLNTTMQSGSWLGIFSNSFASA